MTIIQGDFGKKGKEQEKKKKDKIPVYRLRISLAFSNPFIWRTILVSGDLTLAQLHEVIQLCFGWSGESSHQFYVGKVFYNMSSPNGEKKEYDEANYTLHQLEEPMKWCFTYFYDAGDGWEHDISLEEVEDSGGDKLILELIDGQWASPPEEIGNVHSYEDFLQALEEPANEKNKALLKQHGIDRFDPELFDSNHINSLLNKRSWEKKSK